LGPIWCALPPQGRYLAVNIGVQGLFADSGAVRSARVPNLNVSTRLRRILVQHGRLSRL